MKLFFPVLKSLMPAGAISDILRKSREGFLSHEGVILFSFDDLGKVKSLLLWRTLQKRTISFPPLSSDINIPLQHKKLLCHYLSPYIVFFDAINFHANTLIDQFIFSLLRSKFPTFLKICIICISFLYKEFHNRNPY